jgi:hypothetical protein
MTARTIVGSGPRRRPLPLGREAVERALKVCRFWPPDARMTSARGDTPRDALERAFRLSPDAVAADETKPWLPSDVLDNSPEQLRERLRGYP